MITQVRFIRDSSVLNIWNWSFVFET